MQIKNMQDGMEAYTVPWAMYAERDGKLWLNGNYTIHTSPGGTVQMKVKKLMGVFFVTLHYAQIISGILMALIFSVNLRRCQLQK